jgi:hypothetical protein
MRTGAEPALPAAFPLGEGRAVDPRPPIRVLPTLDAGRREARETLLRRLAADRLRDLRDDGVTTAYVARMYGVERELLEEAMDEVLPSAMR